MKKILIALAIALLASTAYPATLIVKWADPIAASASYVPGYSAEYRVNGGTAVAVNNLTVPEFTATITAIAGNTVDTRYRAINNVVPGYPLTGPWTAWYPATGAATPGVQPTPSITIFAY